MADYIFIRTDPANPQFVVKPYTANGPASPESPLLYNNPLSGVSAVTADTSLAFVGKGVTEYNVVQNNLLFLMEHFAGPVAPVFPTQGQVWYKNTISGGLFVYNGISWDAIYITGSSGDLDMSNLYHVVNMIDPTSPQDAATKAYTDTKVSKAGDTMTGLLILSGNPAVALGAATKQYTDTKVAKSGDTMTGNLVMSGGTTQITLPNAPSIGTDAANKAYVDGIILSNLADVNITSPANNEVLTWNAFSSKWINQAPSGGSPDTFINAGSLNSLTGDLTLTNIDNSTVIITGISPFTHSHTSAQVTFDHTIPYPQTFLYGQAVDALLDPLEPVYHVIQNIDQNLYNITRPWHRQLIIGDGLTSLYTLRSDMVYTIGDNKIQIFKDGVKQYSNERGRQSVMFTQIAVPPPYLAPGSDTNLSAGSYSFNITVDGVGPTLVTITPPSFPYTFYELVQDIDAAFISLPVLARVNIEQFSDRMYMHFDSNSTGAASSILIADVSLFTALASALSVSTVTYETPIAGATHVYALVGNPGDTGNQVNFNAVTTNLAVYEILIAP